MAATNTLTETHLTLLNHASQNLRGRALPIDIGNKGGVATRALKSLLKSGLIATVPAESDDTEWSRDGDGQRMTLTITPAGLKAIGQVAGLEAIGQIEGTGSASATGAPDAVETSPSPQTGPATREMVTNADAGPDAPATIFRPGSKGAAILDLLRGKQGASLPELVAASSWQAHSVRGFLSGTLKKKHGLCVASTGDDNGVRRYRIAG